MYCSVIAVFLNLSFGKSINDIPVVYQEKSLWCWAASTEALLYSYNIERNQESLVEDAFRRDSSLNLVNYLHTSQNEELYPIYRKDDTLYPLGVNRLLEMSGLYSEHYYRGLSFEEFKSEIEVANRVVIFWNFEGGAHVLLGIGWQENQMVELMNPFYGEGFIVMKYSFLKSDKRYHKQHWTRTLLVSDSPFMVEKKYRDPDSLALLFVDPEYRKKNSSVQKKRNSIILFLKELRRFFLN